MCNFNPGKIQKLTSVYSRQISIDETNWHTSDTFQFRTTVGSNTVDGEPEVVAVIFDFKFPANSNLAFLLLLILPLLPVLLGGDKSKASEVGGLFLETAAAVASNEAGGLKALVPPPDGADVGGKKLPLRAKFSNAWVECMSIIPFEKRKKNIDNNLGKKSHDVIMCTCGIWGVGYMPIIFNI